MKRYKYFLIYDRNKQIIYGECIEWRCGEFDSTKLMDIKIGLKNKCEARFITSENRIDQINENGNNIIFPDNISLFYEKEYNEFITQRYDEVIFNPLIDRCSNIKMFVGCEMASKEFQSWIEDHKKLLEEIKTRFDLDLLNRPDLMKSYTYYEPTRIVVNSRFIDKPKQGVNHLPTKLKVSFYDEFNEYGQASYLIIGYCEDKELQAKEGTISERDLIIDFNKSPDEIEIKILDNDSIIYNSRNGFISSIKIMCKVIGGSVALENGLNISKYSEMNINIGKE